MTLTLLEKYSPRDWETIVLPEKIKNSLLNIIQQKGYRVLFYGSPGNGKCLGFDTPVMMYDGSEKMVQDVKVGDLLMGPDSKPRKVLSLARGRERMFKITPIHGSKFTCNESHILSLIESGSWVYDLDKFPTPSKILDIPAKQVEIDRKSVKWYKKKLFKVPLNFEHRDVKIDPYWLGYWLGDGNCSDQNITMNHADWENLRDYMEVFAERFNVTAVAHDYNRVREDGSVQDYLTVRFSKIDTKENKLLAALREYNLIENKHIPKDYLLNDRETRIMLASGLVDSDGYVTNNKNKQIDFAFRDMKLAESVVWLFRSLGFCVSIGIKTAPKICDTVYHRIVISGEFSILKCKHPRKQITEKRKQIKNPLVSGFEMEDIGEGDYYGFELDGDGRFLLYDFTVTHNTSSAKIMSSKDNVLYLSGSNDFNVDTLRQKVTPFASGMAVKGITKTIIIDEFENIRDNVQDAFKIILDKCKNTNFIFCTNEIEKVNTALRSRCTQFDYDFVSSNLDEHKRNYIKWLVNIVKDICKEYNIKATKEGINLLVKNNFPDFRHTLVTLQQVIDSGSDITEESVSSCSDNTKQIVELYELVMNNSLNGEKFYQEICAYKSRERECLMALGEPFFKYLNDNNKWESVIPAAVIVAKYCDNYNSSINKFVSFVSCVSELKTLFR